MSLYCAWRGSGDWSLQKSGGRARKALPEKMLKKLVAGKGASACLLPLGRCAKAFRCFFSSRLPRQLGGLLSKMLLADMKV